MEESSRLNYAFWALKLGLGASTFLAGADKFTDILADWEDYLSPEAEDRLPVSGKTFMRAVGVIEMAVGAGILSNKTRLSSYAAAGWLLAIAGNLVMNRDYDVAVRDVNMAIAALVLAQLAAAREEYRIEERLLDERLAA